MRDIRLTIDGKDRKFKSIREAATASGMNYITLYQRLRIGMKPTTAAKVKVRKYQKAA